MTEIPKKTKKNGKDSIMKTKTISTLMATLFLLSVLAVASPGLAHIVTIDFEDLHDKDVVGTHYPGLTFSGNDVVCANRAENPLGYNWAGWPPHSGDGIIWDSVWPNPGSIRIDFDFCVTMVGAWFMTDGVTVYLYAYDALDTLLASTSVYSGSGTGKYAELQANNIKYVIFQDAQNKWIMDDLSYEQCPTEAPLFSDVLAILPLGIVAGTVVIRRRRKANN